MPSLAEAHVDAQAELRAIITRAVTEIWSGLPGYDRRDLDRWLADVIPLITAGQARAAALTDAFIAHALERAPLGIDPGGVTGAAVRAGTAPEEVYARSFVTVWTARGAGAAEDAIARGLARAVSTAATDMQLAMRATSQAIQDADESIFGWRRVANASACQFCRTLSGAYVKSAGAMPMHPGCGCGLEPLTQPHPLAARLPSGVAVRQHGELGPVLGDPAHDFTSSLDIT